MWRKFGRATPHNLGSTKPVYSIGPETRAKLQTTIGPETRAPERPSPGGTLTEKEQVRSLSASSSHLFSFTQSIFDSLSPPQGEARRRDSTFSRKAPSSGLGFSGECQNTRPLGWD
jgi:hypothetical protein